MTRTAIRILALVVASVAIVASGAEGYFAGGSAAAVNQRHRPRITHRVTFQSPNTQLPTSLVPNCDPAQPTICLQPLNLAPATVNGDLTGTSVTSGVAIQRGGQYPSVSLVAFSGTAAGCGSGSALLVVQAAFDPATSSTRGRWTVYAGQGTGDLSRLTGGGSVLGDTAAFHFRGHIRCRQL